jgi:hypothetical protein
MQVKRRTFNHWDARLRLRCHLSKPNGLCYVKIREVRLATLQLDCWAVRVCDSFLFQFMLFHSILYDPETLHGDNHPRPFTVSTTGMLKI